MKENNPEVKMSPTRWNETPWSFGITNSNTGEPSLLIRQPAWWSHYSAAHNRYLVGKRKKQHRPLVSKCSLDGNFSAFTQTEKSRQKQPLEITQRWWTKAVTNLWYPTRGAPLALVRTKLLNEIRFLCGFLVALLFSLTKISLTGNCNDFTVPLG